MEQIDFLKNILIPLASSIIGGSFVALVNYILNLRKKTYDLKEEFKRKAYGDFIDKSRSFLNDPNLNRDQIIKIQQDFIEKYYNELMVSAPQRVIKAVENFFGTVSISFANEDEKTKALDNVIKEIRKDLGLDENEHSERLYKGYTPNAEKICEEKKI